MQNAACRTALLQSARRALTLRCRKADVSPTTSIAKANLISGHSHCVRTSRRDVVRSYATESAALPRSFLLKTPSPPSPTTQAQHPESAASVSTSIDGLLQDFHFHIRSHATRSKECASTATLYDQLSERAGRMLEDELAYEDKPKTADRRVPINTRLDNWLNACELVAARFRGRSVVEVEDDGLALVSHVIASEPPSTSWSLGFVIRTVQGTTYIVSCSHTLESATHTLRSSLATDSSSFVITRSGVLHPISSIAAALPLHDIVVYNIADPFGMSDPVRPLRSLPVALHPPHIGDKQHIFLIGDDAWRECRVAGYKDPRGNDVEPGTYDELNSLNIDVHPTPGSSGGPLVSEAGSVTALVRGSRMSHGDLRSLGFATPAEKLFELFQLPGLGKKQQGPSGAGFVSHY